MTARELVSASLRLIGVLAPGESIQAQEASDALSALNRLLGSWSNENLLVYSRVREEFTLTVNDGSYSMGSGGDFNTTRPVEILHATIEDQSSSPTVELPMRILSLAEWSSIIQKDTTSSHPCYLYAEGTFPTETLNLYPKPSAAHKLVLYSKKALTSLSTLDTSVSMPSGYDEALIYNLAIRLAHEYGRTVPAEVGVIANESKSAVMRTNNKPMYLRADAALISRSGFNINTGDFE